MGRVKVTSVRALLLSAALIASAAGLSPVAHAQMLYGNYNFWNDRWTNHIWYWSVRPCQPISTDCLHVAGQGNPSRDAAPFTADAHLAGGRYTMVVDVPDGLRCFGANLPTHDTYTWDAASLAGSVDAAYETGCGDAPGGTNTYTFSLERM